MRFKCLFVRTLILMLLVSPMMAEISYSAEPEQTMWYAVFLGGKKVGYMKTGRIVENGLVTTSETTRLEISRGGTMRMEMSGKMVETVDGQPVSFEYHSAGLGPSSQISGRITPEGKLEATVSTPGVEERKISEDWEKGAVMEEGAKIIALMKGLRPRTEYELKLFKPDSLKASDTKFVIGEMEDVDLLGRIVRLTRVDQTIGAITVRVYVDDALNTYKMVTSLLGIDMEIVACTEQYALSPNEQSDFFLQALVSAPRELGPAELRGGIRYEITTENADARLAFPESAEQKILSDKDGVFILEIKPKAIDEKETFPYRGNDPTALDALKPSRWIESDHTTIVAMAREAVAETGHAADAVRKIETYVRGHINRKNLTVGYATALETAQSKTGDCTEHAILAAALLRASGIPARIAVGLAYANAFMGKSAVFVPHAWTQVFMSGQWIGLDAALNGFDAGHIMLGFGNGDPDDFFDKFATMGKIRITKATVVE